jgi:argininosuccinate lyase
VRKALDRSVRLADLPLADFRELDDSLDDGVYQVLGVANAIAAFVSYGSTSPAQVATQTKHWREKLGI